MRRVVLLMLLFVCAASLLLLPVVGCGGGNEPAGETGAAGGGAVAPLGQAEASACAANRSTISSAIRQYQAIKGQTPTSIQQLVPDFLQSTPACPSGGTYSITGGRVVCSVHGS